MTEAEGERRCTTCGHPKLAGDFYAGMNECKTCKRDRSRRYRADQARKLAAFERFVDVLAVLADKTVKAPDAREHSPKAVA